MTIRLFVATLALTFGTAASATAAPTGLCGQLKQLVAAATSNPSFASVARNTAGGLSGTLVPAGFTSCMVSRFSTPTIADSYSCQGPRKQTEAALLAQLAKLNAEITGCFGVQPVKPGMVDSRGYNHMDFFVDTPRGRVTIYTLTPYLITEYRNIGLSVSFKRGG